MWLYLHHLKGRLNCYNVNLCCGLFSEILFHLELLLLQFIWSPVVYYDLSSTSYVHVTSCHILPAPQHPPQRSGVEVTPGGRRWCRGRPELNQPTNRGNSMRSLNISDLSWCVLAMFQELLGQKLKSPLQAGMALCKLLLHHCRYLCRNQGQRKKNAPKWHMIQWTTQRHGAYNDPPGLANGTPICQTFT